MFGARTLEADDGELCLTRLSRCKLELRVDIRAFRPTDAGAAHVVRAGPPPVVTIAEIVGDAAAAGLVGEDDRLTGHVAESHGRSQHMVPALDSREQLRHLGHKSACAIAPRSAAALICLGWQLPRRHCWWCHRRRCRRAAAGRHRIVPTETGVVQRMLLAEPKLIAGQWLDLPDRKIEIVRGPDDLATRRLQHELESGVTRFARSQRELGIEVSVGDFTDRAHRSRSVHGVTVALIVDGDTGAGHIAEDQRLRGPIGESHRCRQHACATIHNAGAEVGDGGAESRDVHARAGAWAWRCLCA